MNRILFFSFRRQFTNSNIKRFYSSKSTTSNENIIDPSKLPVCAQKGPYEKEIKAGKLYSWCTCGLSKKQPLCDGSHKGTGFKPLRFKPDKDETVYFCGCKQTRNPPFCDGTHSSLTS
eukprot:gb/GECH01001874.1/.p1 GENE.gb/GECH01001874.1/~~gb/GECH01001874.1/.p1  ORF type:complete len:118 (+),score=33.01 gb/GECH01001874.1/:1-354(+)